MDLGITVYDQPASESCLVVPIQSKKLHWSIPDPAKTEGAEIEIIAAFEAVFNQLKLRIELELLS